MKLEDAVRLLMPAGELGDEVHEVILQCQREGLIRIEEDGTLVLTEYGKKVAEEQVGGVQVRRVRSLLRTRIVDLPLEEECARH